MAHKQAKDSNLLIKYGEELFACFLAFVYDRRERGENMKRCIGFINKF
jgi:hypothetical protein